MSTSERRVAILSVQSHGDRSYLDDQQLALLSGDLRAQGHENDLVVAMIRPGQAGAAVEARLWERLSSYDLIVFERLFDAQLISRGRALLHGSTFICCEGEHRLLEPPADYLCMDGLRTSVPALIEWLRNGGEAPAGVRKQVDGRWLPLSTNATLSAPLPPPSRWEPNLHPVVVNPQDLPAVRTFSLTGNAGCPYQADARENPLYAGVTLPEGVGRGCAFCTTGNFYEARPSAQTAASVLAQLRHVRRQAPALELLVLKDQNPFGYLAELLEAAGAEKLGPCTLLLETRADWFLRSESRFDLALGLARESGIALAPYLVGIESFSQPELDRYNKGISAETNVRFLEALWRWKAEYGDALDLAHCAFGFVLFSPWTTFADLEASWAGIARTKLDRLRGNLLHSRARLYPDTALYHLARKDGLLTTSFDSAAADNSLRYGYYPAHPWRFRDAAVAHFAAVAAEVVTRLRGSDEVRVFRALLDAFAAAANPAEVRVDDFLASWSGARRGPASPAAPGPLAAEAVPPELRERLTALVRPLALDRPFGNGWRLEALSTAPGLLRLGLSHPHEEAVEVELVPRGTGAHFAASRHYEVRYRNRTLGLAQREALTALCQALRANDR